MSGFYNLIRDYILIDNSQTLKTALLTRNIDATTWGGEAGVAYAIDSKWKADATVAYVRGNNDNDGTALAQLPPLEGRLGLTYDNKVWSVGSLLRLVAAQDRFDLKKEIGRAHV